MPKTTHEFRDPVHNFIRLDPDERAVVNSPPFQRLRHIHQLAMSYLVYPGATHRRFEHSLGCMELASRIFDTITQPEHLRLCPGVYDRIPDLTSQTTLGYWKKTLRFAALCHDIGHLPFSHAAEELLPHKTTHETLTKKFILQGMTDVWSSLSDPVPKPEHIAMLAVGPKEASDLEDFSPWKRILSEIITGDVFGADRMDYLLRDSLHTGVSYGTFDHHRLIDTMRILPGASQDNQEEYNPEPELGIELGGIQVAESLLVARYLMFSQVYLHPVRRIYDRHLEEFLKQTLSGGVYPVDLESFLNTTDNEVLSAIRKAAQSSSAPGHDHALHILHRNHFKKIYQPTFDDCRINPEILEVMEKELIQEFGEENVMKDDYGKGTASKQDFPILTDERRIVSAHVQSKVMTSLPEVSTGYLFVRPELRDKACAWREKNLCKCLEKKEGESCSTPTMQS